MNAGLVRTLLSRTMARVRTLDRRLLVVAGALVVVLLVLAFARGRSNGWHHVTATVRRGDVRDVVQATGNLNAVVTVQVGSEVSGRIAKLFVDFNSPVRRGQVIALIDTTSLQATLLQSSADLENARANVPAAEANLARAQALADQAQADYARTDTLSRGGMETQQALDQARANYRAAAAAVEIARAGVLQARAQVTQRQAAVTIARTNLDHTTIRSPIDGVVVSRNVDVGQTVAASLQAPTLFTIAQDLRHMQVYANVDESDVDRVRLHEPVTFKVDALPKETFRGTVSQVRMNPIVVQNVVTYNAIIDVENPDLKLFPGMTAYVTIPVATAENVVMLPNAALRYRPPMPPDEVRTLLRQYGLVTGGSGAAGGVARLSGASADPAPGVRSDTTIVWKLLPGGSIEPVRIALGVTDHAYTAVVAVLKGQLKEGDEVVTRSTSARSSSPVGPGQGPGR